MKLNGLFLVSILCVGTNTVIAQTACADPVIPDVITPNGDGINDKWEISCLAYFPDNHLTVYNRYGKIVYEADGYDNNWDASWNIDKGPLPDGTYIYLFVVNQTDNKKTYTGSLTVAR